MASTSASRLLPCCCRAALRKSVNARSYATAAMASTSTSTSSGSEAVDGPSGNAQTSYKRPLKQGESAMYDLAVSYLAKDTQEQLAKAQELETRLKDFEEGQEKRRLAKEAEGVHVAAYINDPETRWRFDNGLVDASKPIFRYLLEEAWRENGKLGILMQRIQQMHVDVDLVPKIDPDVDLQPLFDGSEVEAGVFLKPSQTLSAPEVSAQVFHADERLYTLLMVDPDSPDPEKDSFQTYCHWAITNIPISATSKNVNTANGTTLQSYIPPHPQNGTPYHRYTFILYEQPGPLSEGIIPERSGFKSREFAREHDLKPRGVHFYRQVWDETVSKIYADVLKTPEPKYGRPKKVSKYRQMD